LTRFLRIRSPLRFDIYLRPDATGCEDFKAVGAV